MTLPITTKLTYLATSAIHALSRKRRRCPNCGSSRAHSVDRKYLVTTLLRCEDCRLQFRAPTDSEEESNWFYNFAYQEGDAMICPQLDELERLKASNFEGTDRSFSGYIEFLKSHGICAPGRLIDFGCSWGNGSFQFAAAGYDVYSYEIGEARRNYGIEHLGVRHVDDLYSVDVGHPLFETFDCFFSAHVLEHVPSPSRVCEIAMRCLKPGGAFVAFTPNGCDKYRQFNERSWRNMWGKVHPNMIDDEFYERQFPDLRKIYSAQAGRKVMEQYELGFVAWKGSSLAGS